MALVEVELKVAAPQKVEQAQLMEEREQLALMVVELVDSAPQELVVDLELPGQHLEELVEVAR